MGRSRSGSPAPARRRDRDRSDRDRGDRHNNARRRRARSPRERSPIRGERARRHSEDREHRRRRSYSRSRSQSYERDAKSRPGYVAERPELSAADLEGKSPDEQEMMKMMGFCNFDTTKGKKVGGNDVGAVHVILKRKYRQYMNRKGGFNRPLDFVA